MSQIGGYPEPKPEDLPVYKQQFKEGLNLFQQALEEYQKSEEFHQKNSFKEVMDKALNVLNETAIVVLKKKSSVEGQFEKDYKIFIHDASDENYAQLKKDLDKLQHLV